MARAKRRVTTQGVRSEPPVRDVNAALRVEQAIKLRSRKMTYAQIATACGYGSAQSAQKAVMRELDRRISRAVDELRAEEAEMYDDLQRAIYPMAVPDVGAIDTSDGSEDSDETGEEEKPSKPKKPNLFAVDRVLAISEARRALLGLDVPRDSAPSMPTIIEIPGTLADTLRGMALPQLDLPPSEEYAQ